MRIALLSVALQLAALTPLVKAGDLFVDPNGGSTTFKTISAALLAAGDGDRVFVAPGTYTEQILLGNKAVELIGSGSGSTVLRAFYSGAPLEASIAVVRIEMSPLFPRRVRMSGFTVGAAFSIGSPFFMPPVTILSAFNCGEAIELSDLVLDQSSLSPVQPGTPLHATMRLSNCQQVIADRVRCISTPIFWNYAGLSGNQGQPAALIDHSRAWFSDCEFYGQWGAMFQPQSGQQPGNGGPGLRIDDSQVVLSRCTALGGAAIAFVNQGQNPVTGGHGLHASGNSAIRLIGGAGNRIEGRSAIDLGPGPLALSAAGDGVRLEGTSSLVRANDALVLGGQASATQPAALDINASPSSQDTALPRRLPSLGISPPVAQPGQALVIDYQGEPLSVHVRVLGLQTTAAIALPGFSGALLLDPTTFVQTPVVVLDATGQAQVASSLPNLPGLVGFTIVEQSAQVSGSFLDIGTAVILEVRP